MTPGISGTIACSILGWKIRLIKLIKKKNNAKIVRPNEKNMPIFQNMRQIFGFFREILIISLLSFLVLKRTNKGKKKVYASFLLRKRYTKIMTIIQKVSEIKNNGLSIKPKK